MHFIGLQRIFWGRCLIIIIIIIVFVIDLTTIPFSLDIAVSICFCTMVLDFIRLNGIRIISFFLILFFFFDLIRILFAFVQKAFIIDDDVLVSHSSRQPITTLGDFCEKYPDNRMCAQTSSSMPMNVSIPLINDYRNLSTAISLCDIIIPGLLISVCSRLDASKKLLRTFTLRRRAARRGIRNFQQYFQDHYPKKSFWKRIFSGYFIRAISSYAIGLLCSYIIQSSINSPQPVLFYVSPFTLITVLITASRKSDLYRLWDSHDTIAIAARGKIFDNDLHYMFHGD